MVWNGALLFNQTTLATSIIHPAHKCNQKLGKILKKLFTRDAPL